MERGSRAEKGEGLCGGVKGRFEMRRVGLRWPVLRAPALASDAGAQERPAGGCPPQTGQQGNNGKRQRAGLVRQAGASSGGGALPRGIHPPPEPTPPKDGAALAQRVPALAIHVGGLRAVERLGSVGAGGAGCLGPVPRRGIAARRAGLRRRILALFGSGLGLGRTRVSHLPSGLVPGPCSGAGGHQTVGWRDFRHAMPRPAPRRPPSQPRRTLVSGCGLGCQDILCQMLSLVLHVDNIRIRKVCMGGCRGSRRPPSA